MNNEDNATVINPAHGEYGAAEQDATDPNANEERYVEDESLKGLKRDVVKEMLVESLAQTEAPGSFAAFYALADFVNPILMIDNDGPPIRLPLQETDAARIIAASHKAPFGQGSETIVDESVRKTYELNRDQFSILDSGFPRVVFNCVQGAANLLGIMPNQGEIRAELYKLLLYEKGAHFRPHTE